MSTGKVIRLILGVILIFIGLSFAFGWVDVFYTKTVGKAKENARHVVMKYSQSYSDGKVEQLADYHQQWVNAKKDPDNRAAIESTIRSRFKGEDLNYVKEDPILYPFLYDILNK